MRGMKSNWRCILSSNRGLLESNVCMTVVALSLALTQFALGQEFTEGQVTSGKSGVEAGHAFVVGLSLNQEIDVEESDALYLKAVRFMSGGQDLEVQPVALALLDAISYDFNGDPDGSRRLNRSDPAVIAISHGDVNTLGLKYGESLNFDFGDNIALKVGHPYVAVFVTLDAEGDLTVRPTSVVYSRYVQNADGDWVPASSYGEPENLSAAALSSDQNGDGLLDPARDGADLCFEIIYTLKRQDDEPQ